MKNLRECAKLLSRTHMHTESMTLDELDEAMDCARDMEFDVQTLVETVEDAQWSRRDYWRQFFRDDKQLYNADEAMAEIAALRAAKGQTPRSWTGYAFTLTDKGEGEQSYVVRVFDDDVRDVVPADKACAAPHPRCVSADSIFDDRTIVEQPARDLRKTVLRYLLEQTCEPRDAAVALCFV